MKTHLFCLLTAALPLGLPAQKIDYPAHFLQLLNQAGIEFFEPVEAGYRDFETWENPWQPCDFALRSAKEDLQIRYLVLPWSEGDPLSANPHVAAFRTLTNLASNGDEDLISALQPDGETLRRDFNADWGMTWFFKPKPGFSDKPLCRMTALHKEGRGTVFIFYSFDDPANEALDSRQLALRFF